MYLSQAKQMKIEEVQELKLSFYSKKSFEEDLSLFTEIKEILIDGYKDESPAPKGIEQLPKLEKIHFQYSNCSMMPAWLAKLKSLKTLSFGYQSKIKSIPDWISNLEQLEILNLDDNAIHIIPAQIGQLKQLKQLHLYNNHIESLPEEFANLEQLEILDLARNQLMKLPKYIGNFTKLRRLFFNSNNIKRLPVSLKNCGKMEIMHWHKNRIAAADILKIIFHFPQLISKKNYKGKDLELARLAKASRELSEDGQYLEQVISLYLGQESEIKAMTAAELLRIANLKDRSNTSREAITALTERYKDKLSQQPITKGSKIFIAGKTNLKKKQIRQELKKLEIHYNSKLQKDSTHLILGPAADFSEAEYLQILDSSIVILKEADFLDIYNELSNPYLIEGSKDNPEQLAHLGSLLLHRDESNQNIALEMIKTGGLPQGLITELFIFYAYLAGKKNRQKARKLLLLYGSESLQSALRKKYQKLSSRSTDALYEFTKGTELIQWKINQYVFRKLSYWYLHNQKHNLIADAYDQAPKDQAEEFILYVLHKWSEKYKSLSWPWHLSFEQLGAYAFELDYLEHFILVLYEWTSYPVKVFPAGISKLKQLKDLTLQFDMGPLGHQPPLEIFELKELTSLNLTKCQIEVLPDAISNLRNLETIKLNMNALTELPEGFFKLKKLKNIFLGGAFHRKVDAEHWRAKLLAAFPDAKIIL